MKSITSHLTHPLLLSLSLCFFMGCSGDSPAPAEKPAEPAVEVVEPPQPLEDTTAAVAEADTSTQTASRENIAVDPIDTRQPTSVTSTTAAREVDEERLSVILDLIAQDLEAQKLEYRSDLGQDCSGIYHKIKDLVQRRMKALGDKSKYTYPTYTEDRNTRQIANWYHRHNNLYIVQDALADRNKIRPGSVMFFARTDEKFNGPDIATLTNADVFQHDAGAGKGKIYHVGVVTKVEKDDQGNVMRYTLMHGRNSKHTASRTSGNWDGPGGYGKAFAKFPFGNWNQQWVAVAQIETAVE